MKAKLIAGPDAAIQLADRLRYAHQAAGKPSLEELGAVVGYSKGTLSKVFNNKMPPTWMLVRKLGTELGIPPTHVMQEWLPLWIAADTYRQAGGAAVRNAPGATPPPEVAHATRSAGPPGAPAGHPCEKCGAWVIDIAQHAGWHMAMEPGGAAPAAESMGVDWNGESQELKLLREAFRATKSRRASL